MEARLKDDYTATRQTPGGAPQARRVMTENRFYVIYAPVDDVVEAIFRRLCDHQRAQREAGGAAGLAGQ